MSPKEKSAVLATRYWDCCLCRRTTNTIEEMIQHLERGHGKAVEVWSTTVIIEKGQKA